MRAWLLTWNPDKWQWGNYDEECEEASETHSLYFEWSCVSKKAQAGDEFYLMKQGRLPRGIIAHGVITAGGLDGEHWDDDKAGQTINYIAGECDTLLNYKTEDILDVSVLDERCKGQYWHPQSSGIRIRDEVLPVLRELWAELTGAYHKNPDESVYHEDTAEGAKKSVYTTKYERDPKIRRAFLKGKHLRCEVCGFDFGEAYGELGAGYIEVHHKKPVSEGVRMTDLNNDLVMLCANCHRMIHRGKDHMITVEELRRIVASS